jgi:cellobiose transport system permease protein
VTQRELAIAISDPPERPLRRSSWRRRLGSSSGRRRTAFLRYWPQYLAISPFYILFAVFGLFPVLFSLYLSFHRWSGVGEHKFVGLTQYKFLIKDHTFYLSLWNTVVIWVMSTLPMLFAALVLAALLHSVARAKGFYRMAYFIPNVTSVVAMAILFKMLFSSNFGLINAVLHTVGLPTYPWSNTPWGIKISIAALMSWQWVGYNAIIYLAGLQTIPGHLYEAAQVDGAGPVRTFFSITVPLLRPVILFTVVISTITGLQSFTEAQVMTGSNAANAPNSGGPGQAGLTMVLYFYQQAFSYNDFGYGAAIAWAIFLIVSVLTVINWRLISRAED